MNIDINDLKKRLSDLYSVGPDCMPYPDRKFGSYTPAINKEAIEAIELLENEVKTTNQALKKYQENANDIINKKQDALNEIFRISRDS